MPERRVVELELDPPRLTAVLVAACVLLVAAFWFGRYTAGGPHSGDAAGRPPVGQEETVPVTEEDIAGTETIFDRAGEGGAVRELGRQVTGELSLGGRFEIDLGVVSGRAEAERVKAAANGAGVPAVVVGAEGGRLRVAAGPFASRRQAEEAAAALRRELERGVEILSARP